MHLFNLLGVKTKSLFQLNGKSKYFQKFMGTYLTLAQQLFFLVNSHRIE